MNKEILSTINESSTRFRQRETTTDREVCQHIVNVLPAVLEVDNHPTIDEEEQGKGDCTTSYKYFKESAHYSLPNVQISPRIVQRSVWEPADKRANIHMIADVSGGNEKYQVDATHFMSAGYGQVYSELNLHTIQPLTDRDMQIIDKFKYAKHLYAQKLPQADYEAVQILSLEMPQHLDSWRADLELLMANNLLNKGGSIDVILDRLRVIADLNPYKAGILRTIARISESTDEGERINRIRTLVEDNMKKLHQNAISSSNEFSIQAAKYFKNNDIKQGLQYLRLGWWVGNVAEPKVVPNIVLDGQTVPITKLNPMEFNRHGLISIWASDAFTLPRGFDVVFQEKTDLQLERYYGYRPTDLIDYSQGLTGISDKVTIFILKPSQNMQSLKGGSKGIFRIDHGAQGILNSIGTLYPYLTNVDKFSVRSYKLLEERNP